MADKSEKYIEGIGRRKTAVARVRITPAAKNSFTVNGKSLEDFFTTGHTRKTAQEALLKLELPEKFAVSAKILGGGIAAQAESVRHGLARALVEHDAELRPTLKKLGFLKRDPRSKERRKFGLKKARKAAQWSKR